ncbi:MAG: hypothetical protein IKA52_01450 [Bacteroidaceae bacterium]|nr:hypothetical protein [Bacteroidaceae bacterium]
MKKNYFYSLFAALMLFMVMPAAAQNFAITDLFGEWRFTADVVWSNAATDAHKSQVSGDCTAVISADNIYLAKIVGFAGATNKVNINKIGAKNGQDMIRIDDVNTSSYPTTLWSKLYVSNMNGDNPFGYFNDETLEWEVERMENLYYVVDAVNGLITIPDFTVIEMANRNTTKQGTIIATFTNVKMTLVKKAEIEEVEVTDISGDYKFQPGVDEYATNRESEIPTEFAISLVKNSDDFKTYDATFAIEGYDDVELPATFDGTSLKLAFDNLYLDEKNGIRFAPNNDNKNKSGEIKFKTTSKEGVFNIDGGFVFASDVLGKAQDGVTDSLFVNKEAHQWYISGTLKKGAAAAEFSWDGDFKVKVADAANDVKIHDGGASGVEWPSEFDMTVSYLEVVESYFITSIFGLDLTSLNQGGLKLVIADDGKSASVVLTGGYGAALLKSNNDGTYLALANNVGNNDFEIGLTLNEDNTVSFDAFSIMNYDLATASFKTPVALYTNATAEKGAVVEPEPETPAFELAGDYVLTVGALNKYYQDSDVEFPETFDVTITYFDGTAYDMDSYYYVSSFMGKNIGQTPINVNVVKDGEEYELVTGGMCGSIVGGQTYYKLYDMNKTANPLKMTVNADGTASLSNFFIKVLNYSDNSESDGAYYQAVTLTKKTADTAIDNVVVETSVVEGVYDMLGRKVDAITAPGIYIVNGKKVLVK